MVFREVPMFEVREVLRLWLGGEGLPAVARLSRVDRKTVSRYVDAAIEVGVAADGVSGSSPMWCWAGWWRSFARTAPMVTVKRGRHSPPDATRSRRG